MKKNSLIDMFNQTKNKNIEQIQKKFNAKMNELKNYQSFEMANFDKITKGITKPCARIQSIVSSTTGIREDENDINGENNENEVADENQNKEEKGNEEHINNGKEQKNENENLGEENNNENEGEEQPLEQDEKNDIEGENEEIEENKNINIDNNIE